MKRIKSLLFCAIIMFLLAFAQIVLAEGSLESAEGGLWKYYSGMSRQTVRKNAPMYEKLSNSSAYLLDYTEIKGVELFLTGEFKNNKLSVLQIMTAFPEYEKCNKDTKEVSKSFAEVGFALMGVEFKTKQCKQSADNGGTMVCTADDFVCAYRLCPESSWALACSTLE